VHAHRRSIGGVGVDGEAPVIAGGEGGGAAAATARVLVKARHGESMCASGKRLRGLGKVLGGSAGSGEARASKLHGGSAVADGGKGIAALWWFLLYMARHGGGSKTSPGGISSPVRQWASAGLGVRGDGAWRRGAWQLGR
jgi:hypothetical protein